MNKLKPLKRAVFKESWFLLIVDWLLFEHPLFRLAQYSMTTLKVMTVNKFYYLYYLIDEDQTIQKFISTPSVTTPAYSYYSSSTTARSLRQIDWAGSSSRQGEQIKAHSIDYLRQGKEEIIYLRDHNNQSTKKKWATKEFDSWV